MLPLHLWLKLFRIGAPPALPFRCGTMLLEADPEAARRIGATWNEAEDHYIAWVMAHPRPRSSWLETVNRLRRFRSVEFRLEVTKG
jgi:hypothetical protein